MSLGLVEIECPYSLRNTDCLKEKNGVLSLKKHVPIIINAAGSNWIGVVRFCCLDFCGSPFVVRVYYNKELWVPVEKIIIFYQDVYLPWYFGMRLPRDLVALDLGDI